MQLKNCKAKIVVVKLTKTAIKIIKIYVSFASEFHFSFRAAYSAARSSSMFL